MFFVPPKLSPLGLELSEFQLCSSFPSEGYGLTTDGRSIETSYRGGWLTVRLGEPGGGDARSGADGLERPPIIETRIGVRLDGNISCEQLFEVLGLRMRAPATASDLERNPSPTDFSGNTLYWDGGTIYCVSGSEDFRSLLDRLKARHPKLCLIEDAFDFDFERNQLRSHLWVPTDTVEASRHYFLIQTDHPITQAVPVCSFPITASISLSSPFLPIGNILRSHADAEIMPMTWATVSGQCRLDDPDGRRFLEAFVSSLNTICFSLHERIDIATDERLPPEDAHCWYTPEAAAWCEAAPNRFISVRMNSDGDTRRFIGYRPARKT